MENPSKTYFAVGQMSGTSLDGMDWALAEFTQGNDGSWQYQLLHAETIPYDLSWARRLAGASELPPLEYALLERDYEQLLSDQYHGFIANWSVTEGTAPKPMIIGLHGHTVLHQPEIGITTALGTGIQLHIQSRIPVAAQFRVADVALGGQGAPLVPLGDRLLFDEYDGCINLGGFANISLDDAGQRIGFDIGICNAGLNYLAQKLGTPFDRDGTLGRAHQADATLVARLDGLPYYLRPAPKSTGREWAEQQVFPLLDQWEPGVAIASLYAHIANQISRVIREYGLKQVLMTGGGAHNSFLVEQLRQGGVPMVIPEPQLVDFKEALIFAFMGVLRWRGENNVLGSATGAPRDHCSGILWGD